jgi:hypothetical protein
MRMKKITSLALAASLGLSVITSGMQAASAAELSGAASEAGKSAQPGEVTKVQFRGGWRGGRPGYRWRPGYGWVPWVAVPFAIAGVAAATTYPYYYGPRPYYYGPYPYYYGPRY